jgi:hypothetical protein
MGVLVKDLPFVGNWWISSLYRQCNVKDFITLLQSDSLYSVNIYNLNEGKVRGNQFKNSLFLVGFM